MPKVLLVDDEPNIRWTMSELLKRAGYETLTASDFDSAIEVIESNEIDAAVVDIILPRKNGIEILKSIHGRETYIPVVMITGEPNISQIPDLLRAGAYDFISKPVVKDSLIRAVSNAVEKKHLVDEKRRLEQQVRQHAEELELMVAARTRELAEAHNFLNTVLESSTEHAIIALDVAGRVTLFNRGAELLFGYDSEQTQGRDVRELIGDVFSAKNAEAEGCNREEVELRRSDGSSFIASVTLTLIHGPDHGLIGHLAIIRDLTAERRNEEHLRQMRDRLAHNEKITALGRMAAQVAHEVKNPLAGLRLYSLHLKTKAADKLAASEMTLVDKIIDGISHLSDTVDRVLNFARPLTLTQRRVDLNRIIADSLPLVEPQLNAKRISVKLSLAESGAYAWLDESSMRSTIINFMLNSIQAMTDGGELALSTSVSNGSVEMVVRDTGVGMTEEQVKNVFEPFYTTKSQGLGLGMSFAARVIEQHGGSISVDSRVGEGTLIKVALPAEGENRDEARR